MLSLAYLSLFLVAVLAAPFTPELDQHWKLYKQSFKKQYSAREEGARRLIWERNLARIVTHNIEADLGLHSYTLGINHLTDKTAEEINRALNGYRRRAGVRNSTFTFLPPSHFTAPPEIDWRKEGLVTGVKNQLHCGACWAFSTTGSLEGQHKKKTGNLVSLSEQNLVDCSRQYGNNGCEGGLMDYAFTYIKENNGIDTEESYPYEGVDGVCRFKSSAVGATVTGYVDIPQRDENALMKAVASVGPVSVAIDASSPNFHNYKSGIYYEQSCSQTQLDHGVLVIGYGTQNGQDYWLVKNSWGPAWGNNGYIKMSRNRNNQCGIATEASYPTV